MQNGGSDHMPNPPMHNAIWYMQFYSSQSCSPAELCYASNCDAKIGVYNYTAKEMGKKLILQFDL